MKTSNFLRLLLLGHLGLLAACSGPDTPDGQAYFHQVATVQAQRQDHFSIERRYAGLILPRQSTDIGFERAGEVIEIRFDEGDRVEEGQLLARLDTEILKAQRNELEAQLEEFEAALALNQSNMARQQELKTRGFAADQQIDELTAEKRTLDAGLARVQANLESNREWVSKSALVAPFSGTISQRFVDDGAVVSAGTPVVRLIENDSLEARIGVPVRLGGQFQQGDPVQVLAAGAVHAGTVLAVGEDVTRATLTVPLRIAFPDGTSAVAGDQAYLLFDEAVERAGYWLPTAALTEGLRGLWTVYATTPGEAADLQRIEARDVRVLYADEARVFVDGAIADGEWLVSGGLHRLVPGQRVRVEQTLAGS